MGGPIAEPFAALGAGNGFTAHSSSSVCPVSFNVGASNVADYVVLTKEEASHIAWGLAGATGSAEAEYTVGGNTTTATISGTSPNLLQPVERVCKNVQSRQSIFDFGESIPIPGSPDNAQAIAEVYAQNLLTNIAGNASRVRIYTLSGEDIGWGFSDKIAQAEGFIIEELEDFYEREYYATFALDPGSQVIQDISRVTIEGVELLKVKERRDKDSSGSFAMGTINKLSAALTGLTFYQYE